MKITLDDRELRLTFAYDNRVTVAELSDKDGASVAAGASLAHGCDMFVKAVGRRLALTRALHKFTKAERTEIWRQVFASGMKKAS